ncbi:MAG: c-type cytochrome [Polyangiaceae bacterium]
MRMVFALCVAGAACMVGCGDDDGAGATGQGGNGGAGGSASNYYSGPESAALGATTNEAVCATCHSDDGTKAGFAGNSLKDIAYRTSFKGGGAPTLLDATNACVTGWMGGDALTESSPEYQALLAFMQSISDSSVTSPNTFAPEVLADEAAYAEAYSGGDAQAGAAVWTSSCAKCHAGGLTIGSAGAPAKSTLAALGAGRIAQQVRTSGPPPSGTADATDSTPGPMPFFEPQDLSEQDLADVVAYLLAQ